MISTTKNETWHDEFCFNSHIKSIVVEKKLFVSLISLLLIHVCTASYSSTTVQKRLERISYEGSITSISGILVGHSSKSDRPTGCTVIVCNTTCTGGVDVRGSAPGTRETDLLDPLNLVKNINAIVLAGGSVFGLDAASGVVRCLVQKNMGFETSVRVVPIVPAAVLFDLNVGNNSYIVPDHDTGYAACMAANSQPVAEGNVGAGAGATIGKLFGRELSMKAGIGSASLTLKDITTNSTITVGAIVALNAVGDVYKNGTLIAGARTSDGKKLRNTVNSLLHMNVAVSSSSNHGTATTLACVATDAKLTKAEAKKISQMAHDGFARAINPIHTMSDGDVVFTLATGVSSFSDITIIGMMAAEVVERSIVRAVEKSTGLPGFPSIHELKSAGQQHVFNVILITFLLYLIYTRGTSYGQE